MCYTFKIENIMSININESIKYLYEALGLHIIINI